MQNSLPFFFSQYCKDLQNVCTQQQVFFLVVFLCLHVIHFQNIGDTSVFSCSFETSVKFINFINYLFLIHKVNDFIMFHLCFTILHLLKRNCPSPSPQKNKVILFTHMLLLILHENLQIRQFQHHLILKLLHSLHVTIFTEEK